MRITVSFLAFILLAGCQGSGNTPDDGGGDAGEIVCNEADFIVRGTAGGEAVSDSKTVAGQALVNQPGENGCYVNVYFEGGGRLRLEWENTLSNGESAPATGSVNLEAQGGINLGSCSTGEKTSSVTLFDNGVEFVLKDLHYAPYCAAEAVSGELAGCASFVD